MPNEPHFVSSDTLSIEDYSHFLTMYGVKYQSCSYYLQVGEINITQGWILHISVAFYQINDLLTAIIPYLIEQKIPFKIVRDITTANLLLQGNLGSINLGKLVSIYPSNDYLALNLSESLITLTKEYHGPEILTDYHLGGSVYARYGSYNPILKKESNGSITKYIYNSQGKLIPDPYNIPFSLPLGVTWPFSKITKFNSNEANKLLKGTYYPIRTIKHDVKGMVFIALYFKRFWRIKSCLIKQGKKYLFEDNNGRDIRIRLQWQYELQRLLWGIVPVPKIYDYFEHKGNSYLAMEFIHGISLSEWIGKVYNYNCWHILSTDQKLKLLRMLSNILNVVTLFHQKGYIHRDISAGNFLITNNDQVFLIDLELAWSINKEYPNPPFDLGSQGYMSPQQAKLEKPTVFDDIYSIGGLMLAFFTNLHPIKLCYQNKERFEKSILFFMGDEAITQIILNCRNVPTKERPTLININTAVANFTEKIKSTNSKNEKQPIQLVDKKAIELVLHHGMNGLLNPEMLNSRGLWISKSQRIENRIKNEQFEMAIYPGWSIGVSGPLWFLSRTKGCKVYISNFTEQYRKNYYYLKSEILKENNNILPGLYSGGAGIGLALAEGLKSSLLVMDNDISKILNICFSKNPVGLGLSDGKAGQGISLLYCSQWMNKCKVNNQLNFIAENIISAQLKSGVWKGHTNSESGEKLTVDPRYKTAGILLFLMQYYATHNDVSVEKNIHNAFHWLMEQNNKNSNNVKSPLISLAFIRGYQLFGNPKFKEITINNLDSIPLHLIRSDFSFESGLAGLGELYLEAHKVFNSEKYLIKANWLATLFVHTMQNFTDNMGFWITDETTIPTADLLFGNSGILHFLLRYLYPEILGHPLIPQNIF
jgi:serine/threonine protein kinase